MHLINKVLSRAGLRLSRVSRTPAPAEFLSKYNQDLKQCRELATDFAVFKEFYYDGGKHSTSFVDSECAFAAKHIYQCSPDTILDIGSYRVFILGVLAHYRVTTIDVRERENVAGNERAISSDAKALLLQNDSFDAVVSLCAVEHFGLGRYGDEFDIDADKKAFAEMKRVLKPGGTLVFTTSITLAQPSIAFNGHRIYNLSMIHALCDGLQLREECFFSHQRGRFCSKDEVTAQKKKWDVYCGCWTKRA